MPAATDTKTARPAAPRGLAQRGRGAVGAASTGSPGVRTTRASLRVSGRCAKNRWVTTDGQARIGDNLTVTALSVNRSTAISRPESSESDAEQEPEAQPQRRSRQAAQPAAAFTDASCIGVSGRPLAREADPLESPGAITLACRGQAPTSPPLPSLEHQFDGEEVGMGVTTQKGTQDVVHPRRPWPAK